MNAFPKELAKKVSDRWPNMVAGDYVTPPLPPLRLLRHLLEVAYLAAATPEEARYPQFNLLAVPKEGAGEGGLGSIWKLESPRPLSIDELRRLAPSVDFKKSAVLVEWSDRDWHIAGLVDLGTSWGRARTGLQYEYDHPKALFVQVERPGKMKVYQGEFLVASLSDGKLQRINGIDYHLALHEPVHRGLENLAERIASPKEEHPREYHNFVFTAHWNIIAAIANCISDEAHGGAVILVPPKTIPSEQDVRIKYRQNSGNLTDAFIEFMNARNRSIDLVLQIESGQSSKAVRGAWAQAELELAKAQSKLVEAIRFVARLSGCDGAILLSQDLRLLGFGTEIRAEFEPKSKVWEVLDEMRNTGREMDVEQFGLRHRSAIKLVSKQPEYTAIVISQDGPTSVVWYDRKRINVRKGVPLTNLNMPWA
ncbi:putative sensor domain DACNV-containing protein [Bradyrhizobium sp. USDA 4354]